MFCSKSSLVKKTYIASQAWNCNSIKICWEPRLQVIENQTNNWTLTNARGFPLITGVAGKQWKLYHFNLIHMFLYCVFYCVLHHWIRPNVWCDNLTLTVIHVLSAKRPPQPSRGCKKRTLQNWFIFICKCGLYFFKILECKNLSVQKFSIDQ